MAMAGVSTCSYVVCVSTQIATCRVFVIPGPKPSSL